MGKLKKITILHSNDIHGSFEEIKDEETGKMKEGLAQVAGYVDKVKSENPDTVYCIAGDVFQGSLIDSDFQGLSSMDILNLIDIDAMSLGNHELDYGISHMMFVARYADFPIVNANLLMKGNNKHLFKAYHLIDLSGFNILFIGLLTSDIVDQTKAEGLVGSFVNIEDSIKAIEIAKEDLKKKGKKADFIVLLTHIGYEADLELAEKLDPELGVDIIVGGHSHTYIDEPAVVNDILVVQAGKENTHIGRFDLSIDTETKKIKKWKWEMIPVDEDHCPTDKFVRAMVNTYQMDIDEKYGKVITRLKRTLDNYGRQNPTEVGQMFADAFKESLDIDIMLMASSSLRCYSMDMTVTLQDLRETYPYDGKVYKVKVTGEQLYRMIAHMLRDEVLDDREETYYQTSKDLKIVYDKKTHDLELKFKGKPVEKDQKFDIGLQEFYYLNAEEGLGITCDELNELGGLKVIAPDAFEVLKEYFSEHKGLGGPIDKRFIIKK